MGRPENWSFKELARAWAKEEHEENWPEHYHKYLSWLASALWRGEFEAEVEPGRLQTKLRLDFTNSRLLEPCLREKLIRCIPVADYWVLPGISSDAPSDHDWRRLATLRSGDYADNWRRFFLERIVIRIGDFGSWVHRSQYRMPRFYESLIEEATPRGRPAATEQPYVTEMHRRAAAGELSPTVMAESRYLVQWCQRQGSLGKVPALRTIENNIRRDYKRLKAERART